ncbi:hypothetical protein [Burkholderia sp. Ax-1719]|uniref:hypothetical protein n=1 Tax=Burkholderia sp. Ax-1719 TaxID=2608334 RepID=UPI00141D999D|nr:hypothetical protein [Burkholderia sp. Ax-1719]NIE64112.1 hypothetical protein [Burkholderia sp. Ax-1719]
MIEWLGLAYTIGKDLVRGLMWEEQEKLVDGDWLQKSGFGEEARAKGVDLYWSRPDRVATRETEGWAVMYAEDAKAGVRYKLVRYDGTTLMGRSPKAE